MDQLEGRRIPDLDALPFPAALERAGQLAQGRILAATSGAQDDVGEAMRYAVEGGKGLRAFFVIESARLFGIDRSDAAPAAAAIEALHTYSLIHDDLPCMDDDDLRRGKPTVHRKWNEAVAVLAGDALHALAFQLVAQAVCPAERRLTLLAALGGAAGVHGMVGGQAMDMAAESASTPLTLDEIIQLQAKKTGALISWSCTAGAVMAGENPHKLRVYGECLGLAFQIWDDVLDVEGDAARVGKAVRKDAVAGKATFVSLLGLDGAKRRARDLVDEASAALDIYGEAADCLRQAARFVISREH